MKGRGWPGVLPSEMACISVCQSTDAHTVVLTIQKKGKEEKDVKDVKDVC